MQIIQIFNQNYPDNKKSVFKYESDYYYDLKLHPLKRSNGWKIIIQKKRFQTTFKKNITDLVFKEFLKDAEYYVVINENGLEIGWMCISHEKWNNTARLWDIEIYEEYRRQGVGKRLLDFGVSKAKEWGCRALVLECQSSNFPAISFYLKNKFDLTGFDLIAYSNRDIENHEIRLELSRTFNDSLSKK